MKRLFFYEQKQIFGPKIPSRSEDQQEWSKVVFN